MRSFEIDYTGIDPSAVQQLSTYKPHYQQWVIEQIRKGENYNSIIDAVDYYITKIGDNRFQNLLQKYIQSPKNILSLSLDNIKTAQMDFEAAYNRLSRRERDKLKSNVLVDQPGLKIVKFEKSSPGDVDAAKAVSVAAQNTQWCVCSVETAENYLKQGPLYLLIVDGERYLCHVKSNQLMDVRDQPKKFPEQSCVAIVEYITGFGIFCDDRLSNVYRQAIIHNSELVCNYAAYVIKRRWLEAEPTIIKDSFQAYNYAREVIKGRWPQAEPHIIQNSLSAYYYALYIINGRWLEAESTIMQNPTWAYNYACDIIKGRWPQAEPYIMQDQEWAYAYARDIIKGRWSEAESYIIKKPGYAYRYARDVIDGRWPEAESTIMQNPTWAYNYACDIIKGRWPQAEPYIMQNPEWAYYYARDVIEGRWSEAEPTIMNSPYAYCYSKLFVVVLVTNSIIGGERR